MAIYEKSTNSDLKQTEVHLYGSSRLGIFKMDRSVENPEVNSTGIYTFTRGNKFFELSNHLGNVLVTISDRKLQVQNQTVTTEIAYYASDVITATDYYPFGMDMVGRKFGLANRYGFNGKERDIDMNSLTAYDYGFRIYNPAIGKFLSVDPLTGSYPWYTPYQFAGNKPINCIDLDGLEEENKIKTTIQAEMDVDGSIGPLIPKAFIRKRQEHASMLSKSFPETLSLIQTSTGNEVMAKMLEIVSRHFSPNYFDLSWGQKVMSEIRSDAFLTSQEVACFNSYTDYENPGNITILAAETLASFEKTANDLFNAYRQDAFFNHSKFRILIESESDPNAKQALVNQMVASNKQSMFTLAWMCMNMFQPNSTGAQGGSKSRSFRINSVANKFTVKSAKFDYFFGRVVSGPIKNIQRSAQNSKDLTILGVNSESQLMRVFEQAFENGTVISTVVNEHGTTVAKSINIGNRGSISVGFFYKGGNMSSVPSVTSIIPKIFK
ncbi:MAG: hypothetical protein NTW29_09060 [Bacteroidetes bacterium]|nr:hypothetical protein [Bacteroidota bacterium]